MMSHFKFLSQPDNPQMVILNSMQTCSLAAFTTEPKFWVWGCQEHVEKGESKCTHALL